MNQDDKVLLNEEQVCKSAGRITGNAINQGRREGVMDFANRGRRGSVDRILIVVLFIVFIEVIFF